MSHVGWIFVILPIAIDAAFLDTIETVKTPAFSDNPVLRDKYPEDALLNFTELAKKYGYNSVEEHTVETKDGYFLTFFRIPFPRNTAKKNPGKPVLLVHGFLENADIYLLPSPNTSVGALLADAGHDVWFGSVRGTNYGRRHRTLNPDTDERFWDFSYEEMAEYDLPAMIDYILEKSQFDSIGYVGHSQGTTMFWILPTYRPDLMTKIDKMIALAAVAFMGNTENRFLRAITPFVPEIITLTDTLGIKELFANSSFAKQTVELLAQISPAISEAITDGVVGEDNDQLPESVMSVLYGHAPRGVSVKDAAHLGQGIQSDEFQRYDYGPLGNLDKYGQTTPPKYDLSKVTCPVACFVGLNDKLSSLKDVNRLIAHLPNVIEKYIVPNQKWTHLDHLLAKDARKLVGEKIIALFNQ